MIEVGKLPAQAKVVKKEEFMEQNERFKNRIIIFSAIYFIVLDFSFFIHYLGRFTIAFI